MDKHAKRSSLLHYPVLIVFTLFFVGLFALDNGDMLALFVNRDHDNAVTTSVYTASADGRRERETVHVC